MTHIYLVRHGETDWNRAQRIQGSTDIPLNDTGRDQARRTGMLLTRRRWDALASSPLSRAHETAQIIGKAIGIDEVELMPELVERHYGEAEGLSPAGIAERFPGDIEVPGREKHEDVAARVIPALIALADRHPAANVIVATHGGVIRSVLTAIAPDVSRHRGVPITNGSIHSFRVENDDLKLVSFDDPIEIASIAPECGDLDDQNDVERREA